MELKDTNDNTLGEVTKIELLEPYRYEWGCVKAENGKFKRKLYIKSNNGKLSFKYVKLIGRGQVYLHDSPQSLVVYGQVKDEDGEHKGSIIFSFKNGQLKTFIKDEMGLRRLGFHSFRSIDKILSCKAGGLNKKGIKDYILGLIQDKMKENNIDFKFCETSLEDFLKIQQYKFLKYSADIRFTDIDRGLFNFLAQKFKTKNVVKNCLGVSTKKTRKLFFQSLQKDELKTFCCKVAVFHSFYEMGYKLDYLYKILEFKGLLHDYMVPPKWERGISYKFAVEGRDAKKERYDIVISLIGENRFFGEDIHYFNNTSMIYDTCQFIEHIKKYDENFRPRKYKSLNEAHDGLYKILLNFKHKPFDLNQTINEESFKSLEYPQVANPKAYKGHYYNFVIPQTSKDLRSWGDTLHHCVGTYGEQVRDGRTNILGIYKNGELTYCLELIKREEYHANFSNNKFECEEGAYIIGQFTGKFNARPSDEDDYAIRKFLIDNLKVENNIEIPQNIYAYETNDNLNEFIGRAANNAAAGELVEVR